MPDLATPAAPAAPSAPSAPAPAAPAAPAPPPAAAPAPPAPPAAPAAGTPPPPPVAAPGAPAAFDPKTSATPPKNTDYPDNAEGLSQFIADNTAWAEAHQDAAEKLRQERSAAELGEEAPAAEATPATEAVAKAEGEQQQPGTETKPAEPVAAATPAKLDEWTSQSPELKAAFEKNPKLQAEVMEMARQNEAAKPVLEILSTPEEAKFAKENATTLVSLQTNWMLAGSDPEMVQPAWDMTLEMFTERDDKGEVIKGADGKPKLAADFQPFIRTAGSTAIEQLRDAVAPQIASLTEKLNGVYPNEEMKTADKATLEELTYRKAAFDFVLESLKNPGEGAANALPQLPPNATPEQIAYQEKLKAERAELDAKAGKQTTEGRKAAQVKLDREVDNTWSGSINKMIETEVNGMRERGEYLPEFVLTDKWINPVTGKETAVTDFGARCYLALNEKINGNPMHKAKLAQLQALGAAGKDARIAELQRLTNIYLPDIIRDRVSKVQDSIRKASGQQKDPTGGGVARVEPQSTGTPTPQPMDSAQVRKWAEEEAAKQPGYENMSATDREALIIQLSTRKRYGL